MNAGMQPDPTATDLVGTDTDVSPGADAPLLSDDTTAAGAEAGARTSGGAGVPNAPTGMQFEGGDTVTGAGVDAQLDDQAPDDPEAENPGRRV